METYYSCTPYSESSKLGACAVITSGDQTCPDCPFQKVCYPRVGFLIFHWKKLSEGLKGLTFAQLCEAVRRLPLRHVTRYGDAGDLPGEGNRIDARQLRKLVAAFAARKLRAFSYTHKPPTIGNLSAIREAIANGFTINLSAEGYKRADKLADTGLPVVTVLPSSKGKRWKVDRTPAGRRIVQCPAEWTKDTDDPVQCIGCGGDKGPLCWRADRDYLVGFTAHSRNVKRIDSIIANVEANA